MSSKIDATDKRIIYVLHVYGKSMSYKKLHRVIKELKDMGVRFNIRYPEGSTISSDLEQRLRMLIEKGYIKELYIAGSTYTTLYMALYKLTEKGESVIEKIDIDKKDMQKIDKYFSSKETE